MAFRFDMMGKTRQQQVIVSQRDDAERIRLEKSQKKEHQKTEKVKAQDYPISIYMKLGIDSTGKYNGYQTMGIYQRFISANHLSWFCTNALNTGMSNKKIKDFKTAIMSGNKVSIYFVIGKSGGGFNEIEYKAQILDIASLSGGMKTPEECLTPDVWKNIDNSIWIKIGCLEEYNLKSVKDFEFVKNHKLLKDVLKTNSCFGYIQEI